MSVTSPPSTAAGASPKGAAKDAKSGKEAETNGGNRIAEEGC